MSVIYGDYHTHTIYSDGEATTRENVTAAIKVGLKELAITDHGFANPRRAALSPKKFARQRTEIDVLKAEFGEKITILHGIEADLIGLDGEIDLTEEQLRSVEVLNMGFHSFAKAKNVTTFFKMYPSSWLSSIFTPSAETVRRNTRTMIAAIKKYPIDTLAHINHLMKVDSVEVARAAADYGTYIEINAKHVDLTKKINLSHELFEKLLTTDVKFIANTDAHKRSAVGGFETILAYLKMHDTFDYNRLVNYDAEPKFPRRADRIK